MNHSTRKTAVIQEVSFRWRSIALPLAALLLSLLLVAFFYRLLPSEAAYHFDGGTPDRWLSRNILLAWLVVPQLFLTLFAWVIAYGGVWLSRRFPPVSPAWIERILLIMGNMVGLPQLILGFAMLDIFSYNAYQMRLFPLWAFAVIVMGVGGVVLGAFFFSTLRQVWSKNIPR